MLVGEIGEASSLGSGKFVVLSVSDTGTGMDSETQKRIFEPFFTTKGIGRGTGLGLSTVYGIVQQCGGQVRVKSEVGRGTRFEIYLPSVEGLPSVPSPALPGTLPALHRAATILLVDDDDDVRRVASRILRRQGYTVLEARNAGDARGVCARGGAAVDLLLTDVVMPETTGPALAAELCQGRPAMRVLYMSGYSNPSVSSNVASELVGYLAKPFTPRTLVETVRQLLHVNEPTASRDGG